MVAAKAKIRLGALIILLIIMLLIECIYPLDRNTKYVTSANEITYKKYMFIPYGENESSLGLFKGEGQRPVIIGPNSFSVAADGTVYILDTVNYKVKRYTANGNFMYSIELPKNAWAFDFEVAGNTVYLMSGDYNLYRKGVSDKEWTKLGSYSIMSLAGLYAQGNEVYGRAWDGADLKLSASEPIKYLDRVDVRLSEDKKQAFLTKDGVEHVVNYEGEPIGSYIIKADDGTSYVFEYDALMKYYPYLELRIGKYVDGEKKETALAAPMSYYLKSNPYKKLYVTDGGEVFQMVPLEAGVLISVVPWFSGEKTRITEVLIEANETKLQ